MRTGDPNGDFLSTSERDMILNDAARKVASDLYRNGTALLTDRKKIQLEPAVTEYALPDDLIGVQEVFWEDNSTRYEVEQRPLQSFQDIDRTGERPIYYDVFGQTGEELVRSSVGYLAEVSSYDQTFSLTLDENEDSADLTLDYSGLDRVDKGNAGDIVYNLTDGSSGTIAKDADINTTDELVTVLLTGGKSNVAIPGDQIVIESAEKPLPILHIYPQLTMSATVDTIFSGSYDLTSSTLDLSNAVTVSLSPTGDEVHPCQLYGVRFSGGVLADINPFEIFSVVAPGPIYYMNQTYRRTSTDSMILKPQEDIRLRVLEGMTSLGTSDPSTVWTFFFSHVTDVSGGNPHSSSKADFDLLKLKDNTPLVVYYARYPRRLTATTDELELPEIALEAVLLHAEYEVHLKAEGGRNNLSSQAYALYEMELQKTMKFLRTRNIRGSRTVRNVMYG